MEKNPKEKARDTSNNTKMIALAGILSAFIVAVLVIGNVVPTGRLGFQVLASFLMIVVFLETDIRYTLAAWVVTSVLAFFLLPDKTLVLAWGGFFGLYPIMKNIIEKFLNKRVMEIGAKVIFFLICLGVGILVLQALTPALLPKNEILLLTVVIAVMIFLLFDELATRWIHFYFMRISPLLHRRKK